MRELRRIVIFDALGDFQGKVFHDLSKLEKAISSHFTDFTFIFVPKYGYEVQQLDKISYMLARLQSGYKAGQHSAKMTLLVDELDLSFPTGIKIKQPDHGFGFLCCRGRHFGINIIGITQRTAMVDTSFRGNLSDMYVFRQSEPIDINKSCEILGRDYRPALQDLCDFEYIYKSGNHVKIVKNKKK